MKWLHVENFSRASQPRALAARGARDVLPRHGAPPSRLRAGQCDAARVRLARCGRVGGQRVGKSTPARAPRTRIWAGQGRALATSVSLAVALNAPCP